MEKKENKDSRHRPTVSCDGCRSRKTCLSYVPGNYASADCLGYQKEIEQSGKEPRDTK